ncbi:hypothetical protein EUGRSUZ_F03694 [Eucalyptus grandis]|uniref:Uncharacterized protein n=2 Tax=Eucalyptus grandis TaxID=71139 RepID=A0ACC3KM83_EUCGR|nr:hypothetical protein EUGRSUZ_F03694 [Eucalyptus grandis]
MTAKSFNKFPELHHLRVSRTSKSFVCRAVNADRATGKHRWRTPSSRRESPGSSSRIAGGASPASTPPSSRTQLLCTSGSEGALGTSLRSLAPLLCPCRWPSRSVGLDRGSVFPSLFPSQFLPQSP